DVQVTVEVHGPGCRFHLDAAYVAGAKDMETDLTERTTIGAELAADGVPQELFVGGPAGAAAWGLAPLRAQRGRHGAAGQQRQLLRSGKAPQRVEALLPLRPRPGGPRRGGAGGSRRRCVRCPASSGAAPAVLSA